MLPWYMTAEWWYLGAGACPVANALDTPATQTIHLTQYDEQINVQFIQLTDSVGQHVQQ